MNTWVDINILDAWSRYMNNQEEERGNGEPLRWYMSCTISDHIVRKKELTPSMVNEWVAVATTELLNSGLQIDDISLIFIPVLEEQHYYLMCFNTKEYKVQVLDNRISPSLHNQHYKRVPKCLHGCFCVLMSKRNKEMLAQQIRNSDIDYVQLPWSSLTNMNDCAIFTMWHEENYMGLYQWKAFLQKDNVTQLKKLRVRFLLKLLSWKKNTLWSDIYVKAQRYFKVKQIPFDIVETVTT